MAKKKEVLSQYRTLNICGMECQVGRIGYPDEGLRLTLSIGSPYEYSAEVKLTRADAEWLRDILAQQLNDRRNDNMPKGS